MCLANFSFKYTSLTFFWILLFLPQIYEYQGCQAAQDLLRGQDGETLPTASDQSSLNVRGHLFERFFSLHHVTNVASNGEHLNRECSLFTDDCRYVIVGSAVYVPEEPPPYFFEVTVLTVTCIPASSLILINDGPNTLGFFFLTNELKSDANRLIYYIQPLLGVSEQWISDSKPPLSTGRLLAPHYWPSHRQAEWHQVLQVWQDNPVPQPRPVPLQEYPGCSLSPATNHTCVSGGKSQHFGHVTFCITFILETYMVKCPWWNFEIDYRYSILRKKNPGSLSISGTWDWNVDHLD